MLEIFMPWTNLTILMPCLCLTLCHAYVWHYAMLMLEIFMPCLCLTLCHAYVRKFMPCLCLTLCLNKNIGSCVNNDTQFRFLSQLEVHMLWFMSPMLYDQSICHYYASTPVSILYSHCKFIRSPSPFCVCNHAISLPFSHG